ncbi:MAG: SPFH domain-containing protein [Deltaproteobacteria bacterium]|nr:SPFH domain-containing protein [Deltaproteobacteria bacterium]
MNTRKLVLFSTFLTLLGSAGCVPRSTDANEVGVRFCKIFCGEERAEIIEPGRTIFMVPVINDWYTLDISMQDFYMTRDPESGDRRRRDDLLFKTREGNNISQDVVMTWKLDFRQAERIIEEVGPDIEHIKEKYVRPIARSVIRDHFSKLNSDEYYEGQRRFEEAKNATIALRENFAPYGIIIDQVNPRAYQFEDPNYQEAINAAKEAGQDLEKYLLEKDSQVEFWKKELEKQIGASNQTIAEAGGASGSIRHAADAALEERKNEANAILAEKEAEAKAIRKLNEAMMSRGGETAVKMEYARHFNPDQITVLPCAQGSGGVTVQRLDINDLIAAETAKAATR